MSEQLCQRHVMSIALSMRMPFRAISSTLESARDRYVSESLGKRVPFGLAELIPLIGPTDTRTIAPVGRRE